MKLYIYRKKVCRVSLSRHPRTPHGRRCYRRHDKKREPLFSQKNHRKQFRKSRSENRIRFLFGFRFGFALATIGGISLRGKKKTRHGGRGFYYRCHQRRGVFCFSHHRTRSAMSAGCVSGIVIRSQPLGVR